jgi:hypothetical protein
VNSRYGGRKNIAVAHAMQEWRDNDYPGVGGNYSEQIVELNLKPCGFKIRYDLNKMQFQTKVPASLLTLLNCLS